MGTVSITGVSPDSEIYGASLAAAINHVKGRFGPTYTAWLALGSDDQAKTLVSATDYMDGLGLVDDGVAIGHSTTIAAVQKACYELAVLIADDPDIVAQIDQSSNIKRVKAGTAEVEYHNPTSTRNGTAERLPHVVQQLLADYLPTGSAAVIGGYGQAGDGCLDDGEPLDMNGPF